MSKECYYDDFLGSEDQRNKDGDALCATDGLCPSCQNVFTKSTNLNDYLLSSATPLEPKAKMASFLALPKEEGMIEMLKSWGVSALLAKTTAKEPSGGRR